MTLTTQEFERWKGREETARSHTAVAPIEALLATLDHDIAAPRPGDALPPLGHWLFFWPAVRQSGLGEDGHPARGGFLPPVPLPRRMWAAGRVRFHRDLPLGVDVARRSSIRDIAVKSGRMGELVFVTVDHEIRAETDQAIAIEEEQTIVYRQAPAPGAQAPAKAAPADAAFEHSVIPDPVMLFRYSALTFNSHRIHYDLPYVTGEEGYPGLIVHGPLTATLLIDLFCREHPGAKIAEFSFRAMSPAFANNRLTLAGKPAEEPGNFSLWAKNDDGHLIMQADLRLS